MISRIHNVNGCSFREDVYYYVDENLWFEPMHTGFFRVGILPTTQTTYGKIKEIKLKQVGAIVEERRSLALIEARRFLGHIYSPFKVVIKQVNPFIAEKPHVAQERPYADGWLYVVEDIENNAYSKLQKWDEAREKLESEVIKKGVMCFSVVPDYVYAAIGIDCSQVVMILSDKISEIPIDAVLHVVADYDEGAEIQLNNWANITGNEILDFRLEKKIAHALIRRKK